MQEVQRTHLNQLQSALDAMGYDCLYCSTRPDSDTDFGPLLAYRRDRLALLSSNATRTCTFSTALERWHPPAVAASNDAFHTPLHTHREGAAMALLSTKHHNPEHARRVCAVSTHLHWDPKLPDVKAAQAAVLCSEVQRFRADMGAPDAAVIIGGDFNSLPIKLQPDPFDPIVPPEGIVSGAYTIMTGGNFTPDKHDHPATLRALNSTREVGVCMGVHTHAIHTLSSTQYPFNDAGLGLVSVYAAVHGREPLVTNCTDTFRGCLDYVFCSPNCRVAAVLPLPYSQEQHHVVPNDIAFPAIPNEHFPSDHLPVGADIVVL